MQLRRSIKIKLKDGNEYSFSERNKEDVDYVKIQDRIRTKKAEWINATYNDEDQRNMLLIAITTMIFPPEVMSYYMMNDMSLLKEIAFDSFKIANKGITIEQFNNLIDSNQILEIHKIINELESESTADIESELNIFLGENKDMKLIEFINEVPAYRLNELAKIISIIKKKEIRTKQ